MARIGIFSGSFDPIHKGHIAFALESARRAGLDTIYFAPEVKPRRKPHVSHIAHRTAMINLVCRAYPNLRILELPDKCFSSKTTMPKIEFLFPEDEIFLLFGTDLLSQMSNWPQIEFLLNKVGLVIGARGSQPRNKIDNDIKILPVKPKQLFVIDTPAANLSASVIREQLANHKPASDILPSVANYAQKHWLYHRLPQADKSNVI